VTLMIDPRAGSKELYKPLKALRLPVRLKQMRFGDIAWTGLGPDGPLSLGIEYKKYDELLACIIDKRLVSHQIPGLVSSYDRRYLLIEGIARPYRDSSIERFVPFKDRRGDDYGRWHPAFSAITWAMVEKYCATLQEVAEVRVRFTSCRAETIGYIAAHYAWWQKPWEKHHAHLALPSREDSHPRRLEVLFRRPSVLRRIASCLPGVGWHKSELVSKRFKTVSAMVDAGREDWLDIEGIGSKTATAIHRALRGLGENR
jgi:ERCC4-type nuclease